MVEKIVERRDQRAAALVRLPEIRRPGDAVGRQIIVPPAHLRRFERQPQPLLVAAKLGGGGHQRRRALAHPLLELLVQPLQLLRRAIEVGEDPDLGAQDLRHHGDGDIVHGARLVAAQEVEIGEQDGGDEDDRRPPAARMVADHPGELEAVEIRHADVDQHDRDIGFEQVDERLLRRAGLEQRLAELLQDDLVAQQLGRLVVDQQDVDGIGGHDGLRSIRRASLNGAATCGAPRAAARCSPAWRGSPRPRLPGTSRDRPSSPWR